MSEADIRQSFINDKGGKNDTWDREFLIVHVLTTESPVKKCIYEKTGEKCDIQISSNPDSIAPLMAGFSKNVTGESCVIIFPIDSTTEIEQSDVFNLGSMGRYRVTQKQAIYSAKNCWICTLLKYGGN